MSARAVRVGRVVFAVAIGWSFALSLGCASKPASPPVKAAEEASRLAHSDPWYRAARTGDIPALEAQIKAGRPVDSANTMGVTALMVTCRNGNLETAKWLMLKGADVNRLDNDGQGAIAYALGGAAQNLKHVALVDELLKNGADPFLIDKNGWQPIREMIVMGLDAQVRSLKYSNKKACDRVPMNRGDEPLASLARRAQRPSIAEFLEKQGCW